MHTSIKPVAGDVDPNVSIPAAAKAAAAHAESFYKQPETEVTPEVTPEPVPEVKAETPPEVKPEPKPEAPQESWEHRYKSMKGRYDRLNDTNRELSNRVASLEQILSTMQASTPPEPSTERQSFKKLITEDEERDYGTEFLSVVGKKAKEELVPELSRFEQQLADIKARLDGVSGHVVQDARQRMISTLDERIPNWTEVNDNPDFLQWLRLPDIFSGAIRHDLLKAAWERNDTPRVAAFFQGFLSEEAATDPANPAATTPAAQAPAKVPLESFAAPGRAKTAAAGAPAEKPTFTRAQITKFYVDCANGAYRGKDAERQKLEVQIIEAANEGRIR